MNKRNTTKRMLFFKRSEKREELKKKKDKLKKQFKMAESATQPSVEKEYLKRKVWQMYSPYYYDMFIDYKITHKALTFDWIGSKHLTDNVVEQGFIVGTMANMQQESELVVMSSILPNDKCEIRPTDYENGMIGDYTIPSGSTKIRPVRIIKQSGDINRCKYLNGTSMAIIQSGDGRLNMVNIDTGACTTIGKQDSEGFGISVCPYEPKYAVTGSTDCTCRIWDIVERKESRRINTKSEVNDVDFCICDYIIITANENGKLNFIDPRGNGYNEKYSNNVGINCCSFSPLLQNLYMIGDENGFIKLFDTRHEKTPLFELKASDKQINNCQFSPLFDNLIVISSDDHTTRVFDLNSLGSNPEIVCCFMINEYY